MDDTADGQRGAFELVGDPTTGPFLFTCEHASARLPEWEASAADLPWLAEHWGWDIGAADLTRVLARRCGSAALLSRFSRLVCDPNRRPDEEGFVVTEVEGHALSFNRNVDDAERERRNACYAEPYHAAIDRALAQRRAAGGKGREVRLCSIHSFAPLHSGKRREMEMGVLFDSHEVHAERLVAALEAEAFVTAPNEPYSGYAGMIHAASRHGRAHDVVYLELEVRNDLIDTPARAEAVGERIARALADYSA